MIVVGSTRSAGATTLALALAARLGAVIVEADPAGGVLALRHGLGREPGLATLAVARAPVDIADHAQLLPSGLAAVVAPESPERTGQVLRMAGDRLVAALAADPGRTVVVDAGRLLPGSPALGLAMAARVVVVVARPSAEHLMAAAERVADLGDRAGLVLVGSGPYRAADVASQLACPVLATIPDDPRAAKLLADGVSGAALARTPLARAVATLAATLAESEAPATGESPRLSVAPA